MKKYIISTAAYVTIGIEAENAQEAEEKALAAPLTDWEVVGLNEFSYFYTEAEDGDDD